MILLTPVITKGVKKIDYFKTFAERFHNTTSLLAFITGFSKEKNRLLKW